MRHFRRYADALARRGARVDGFADGQRFEGIKVCSQRQLIELV